MVPSKPYSPLVGRITEMQFELASRECIRRQERGEKHPHVLVARDVPVKKWEQVKTMGKVEAIFSADGSTVCVEFIGIRGHAHEAVVAEVTIELGIYARANNGVLMAGGGLRRLAFPDGEMRERSPDTALRPVESLAGEEPVQYRLIVEVNFTHYSLSKAQAFCREYFEALPLLRAVLLIQVYPPTIRRSIACVAILYLRDPMDNVW
jgi:hypothetical protein